MRNDVRSRVRYALSFAEIGRDALDSRPSAAFQESIVAAVAANELGTFRRDHLHAERFVLSRMRLACEPPLPLKVLDVQETAGSASLVNKGRCGDLPITRRASHPWDRFPATAWSFRPPALVFSLECETSRRADTMVCRDETPKAKRSATCQVCGRFPVPASLRLCTASYPQISFRIEEDIAKRNREKCRMLWVAVPGHHILNDLRNLKNPGCPITVPIPSSLQQLTELFDSPKLRLRKILFVDLCRSRESGMPHQRLPIARIGPHHP